MTKLFKPFVILAQAIILIILTLKWWKGSLKDSFARITKKLKKK